MRLIKLLRSVPFYLALIVIILLNINNQKQDTTLKILIWNTPSFSIGNYLAISSGTGFLLSYIITSSLSRNSQFKVKKQIQYKSENSNSEKKLNHDITNQIPYDNTFIERDIKDPSPTIDASFRVIGKTNKFNQSMRSNQYKNDSSTVYSDETDTQKNEQDINFEYYNNKRQISNDWEDDSYIDW